MDSQFEKMIAWENGNLDDSEEIALFQELVDSGLAWNLQGMYGRRAAEMLKSGEIKSEWRHHLNGQAVAGT